MPLSFSAATTVSATAPVKTKKKIANSPWSATEPTSTPHARA